MSAIHQKLPTKTRFSSSEVQRKYRALLDMAANDPVVIVDRGHELVVLSLEVAEFDYAFRRWVQELARFSALYTAHHEEDPRTWAQQSAFPWIASLSRDEVAEMAQELLSYTLDAAQRHSLDAIDGCLRGWASTAEIYGEPQVLEQMLQPFVPQLMAELSRPDA